MSQTRLLKGIGPDRMTYQQHCDVHGPPVQVHNAELRAHLAASGLRGRGGAGFPFAYKIDALARGKGRRVLIANGCEGEPMSGKDRVLMRSAPHLVIDGAVAVAEMIQAERILLAIDEFDLSSCASVREALSERTRRRSADRRIEVTRVPAGYVTGQETALVNWCNTARAAPTGASRRVTDRGVDRRPTLVSNVETLAHAGLIARHGTRWFRKAGTVEDPGTTLITLGGAVMYPGVYEVDHGEALSALLRDAGGVTARIAGVLIGGYAGGWVGPDQLRGLRLDRGTVQRAGARLGAGSVVVLPVEVCPVSETARVAWWMAAQSAGQCGPCIHGLAGIADALEDIRSGRDGRRALADVACWCAEIPGRGACAHPDGVVGFVASALRVFRAQFIDHADGGPCDGCDARRVLETPGLPSSMGTR